MVISTDVLQQPVAKSSLKDLVPIHAAVVVDEDLDDQTTVEIMI
jgi:hypothetical protein